LIDKQLVDTFALEIHKNPKKSRANMGHPSAGKGQSMRPWSLPARFGKCIAGLGAADFSPSSENISYALYGWFIAGKIIYKP
jgi:hypothetical protein